MKETTDRAQKKTTSQPKPEVPPATPPKKIEGDDGRPHYPNEIYEEKLPPPTELK